MSDFSILASFHGEISTSQDTIIKPHLLHVIVCISAKYFIFYLTGSVKVWDPRQKNEPVATMEPGEGETKRDCWSVAFGK